MTKLAENYYHVIERIEASVKKSSRSIDEITLIAVSKTRTLNAVKKLLQLGQHAFGENTIQDAMTKIPELSNTSAQWHFIGHLQSKKSKFIPGYFQWLHSVDNLSLAQKLSTAMQKYNASAVLNCLIQVNVSEEQSKSGLLATELLPFYERLQKLSLPGLCWRGLMTIGVQGDNKQTRKSFELLRTLQQKVSSDFDRNNFDQLSMGMSGDYTVAIEEGATLVRVGTDIFGSRH